MGGIFSSFERVANSTEEGVVAFQRQGDQLNETLGQGFGDVNENFNRLNETGNFLAGQVEIGIHNHNEHMNNFGELAGNAIENHNEHMNNFGELAGNAIENHNRHMNNFGELAENAIEDHNRHMNEFREEAAAQAQQGIRAFDEQADNLNRTAEETAQEIERAVDAFQGTTGMIDNSIEEWAPAIGLILRFIGPLQVVAGLNHFSQIVRNLGGARPIPVSVQELKETNGILKNIAAGKHQKQMKEFVLDLTESSMRLDQETGKLTLYFFYTQNNFLVHQLKQLGNDPKYFAYDSIRDLLKAVSCWNKYFDILGNRNRDLVRLGLRSTKVYFLDPPPTNITLSKVEFLNLYKDISFINYFSSTTSVKLKSIEVHQGCSVRLENVTVCKTDGECEGEVYLHKCALGWDPNKHIIDRVTWNDCQKMKTSWKRAILVVAVLVIVVLVLGLRKSGVIFKSEPDQIAMNCEMMCKSLQERYNETVRVGGTDLRAEVLKYLSNPSSSVYGPIINCWDVSAVSKSAYILPPRIGQALFSLGTIF
eukprot:scaffold1333_cov86-Cylindrotheca_fusiformis.AAC.2